METNLNLKNDKVNSITLKKDSKGNYNWDIKVYFNGNKEKCLSDIKEIDNKLKEVY